MSEPLPLLLDASHTSHTRAQTGIQRVCRSLFAELESAGDTVGLCFDPHLDAWRPLSGDELSMLRDRTGSQSGSSRGSRWSLPQKISSHARRLSGRPAGMPPARGLVCPELFSARVGAHLPELIAQAGGPSVAIFHDAIALKFPELTTPTTVARLPAYLRELLQFDGVAAVSDDSAACLRDYWHWLGVSNPPPVETISHGVDDIPVVSWDDSEGTGILSVGTLEGRKNHLALLEAAELLWADGLQFELEIIGLARADTGAPALERIRSLQRAGRPLTYHGSVADRDLHAAYARCAFTVYPSLMEGFGLPVIESLRHGKPCICSARGALGESARGGGCLALESLNAASLAIAMRRLLNSGAERAALRFCARAREFRSWSDCARDLAAWMDWLRRH